MITFAAVVQLLIALAFVSIPVVRHRYGGGAGAHAEAELERQGIPVRVLKENKINFDASGHETWAPGSIALVMAALAVLNLSGSHWGEVLSWVFLPLVFLGNLAILYSQLTAVKSVEAAFKRKGDPMLQRIDVPALIEAAGKGFPAWVMPILQNVRHAVVLGGAVLAMVALTMA